jgi:hypothetical protein
VTELSEPVFSDGLTVVLDGLFSPRWGLSVTGGYSSGESALYTNTSNFDTYTGNIRVLYAVSRMWAAYVDYLYYYYDFRGRVQLLPGVPSALERNGVRAGLTLWMPVIRK